MNEVFVAKARSAGVLAAAALAGSVLVAGPAAADYYIGEPVVKENLQLSPAYLRGIEMEPMPADMSMDKDAIHIEIDIHATDKETHGFGPDEWIPYLGVTVTVENEDGTYTETKDLHAMQAIDGPHYANNFAMKGPGTYKVTYVIEPPSTNGFIRHIDKATGVPPWWPPITASWTFTYPAANDTHPANTAD